VDNIQPAETSLKNFELNTFRTAFDPYAWTRSSIKTSPVNNNAISKFNLSAGSHEVTIVPRNLGARFTKVVVSKDPNFIQNDKSWSRARTLVYDLSSIENGLRFMVDVQEFDSSSYLVFKPRFQLPVGKKLKVQNIKAFSSATSFSTTWQTIDEIITGKTGCDPQNLSVLAFGEADARFSGCQTFLSATPDGGLILVKSQGLAQDELKFSFEKLEIVP
jgi:hypothetical protein